MSHDVYVLDYIFDVLFYTHSHWEHIFFGVYPVPVF